MTTFVPTRRLWITVVRADWNTRRGVFMIATASPSAAAVLAASGPESFRIRAMKATSARSLPGFEMPGRGLCMADDDRRRKEPGSPGTAVISKTKPQTKRPSLYRVLILNDDYTPMEFVVHVLERFFSKDRETATQIMLHVHHHGIGECGVFTYEVAETKVTQVMDFARKHQHPLQCVMEKK